MTEVLLFIYLYVCGLFVLQIESKMLSVCDCAVDYDSKCSF